ncbi:MAG: YihA family ribosome biogenesis GTP-binding protein [Gammaproteobacteria bacterium]|nr:YihA family ribosome biogenesis GTP-binding protein [Gammaproteobacteria bacterium]MYD80722.1 YihA family ribosome biogenesis GTP-binding protein [Gammaproteobacteria bacterium]
MTNEHSPIESEFLKSALLLRDCPNDDVPEVAFAGRSNAGKSSTINSLTGSRKLARVSKTPGRTQLINFFDSRAGGRLVDLPGFGFARADRHRQIEWQKAVDNYLERRKNLVGLVLIMDARHPLRPFDTDMIEWTERQQMNLLVLLNKSDKLKQSQRVSCVRVVTDALKDCDKAQAILFSALKGTGVNEARHYIRSMLEKDESLSQ